MKISTALKRGWIVALLLLCNYDIDAQVLKDLKAKKESETQLWGYENKGEQEYWWKEAHSLGKNEESLTLGYNVEWCISPQYEKVSKNFGENLAGVELMGKVGFIDKNNRYLIEPQFEPVAKLAGFNFGLAAVKKDGKYGFINKKGVFVIEPSFDYAENFGSDMLATIKSENKFGAIDLRGVVVVPCTYLTEEGMKLLPAKNKQYKAAAKEAKIRYDEGAYDLILDRCKEVSQEVNAVIRDTLWYRSSMPNVLIIAQGNRYGLKVAESDTGWILKPSYDEIESFADGYYKVRKEGFYGVCDSYGRSIIPCDYTFIYPQPDEGIFIVTKVFNPQKPSWYTGLYSYTGAMIIPSALDSISDFYQGVAIASAYGKNTFIDRNGQVPDAFIEMLVNNEKNDRACRTAIALRPTCAIAHNNLGISFLNSELNKEGMSCLKIANKLDPDNEVIQENLKQAKDERKERRKQRTFMVLDIITLAATAAADGYAIAKGGSASGGSLAYSSFDSSMSSASSSSSATATSSRGANDKDRNARWMTGNYQSMKNSYSSYENQLIQMKAYPERYNDATRRNIQAKMKQIRETIVSHGGTCSQSYIETWRP